MTESATIEITDIAAGGDGVGRSEGLVVFVPRAAVGDRLTVEFERKARFARGAVTRIDAPSADRVAPACEHYVADACGGCQLQHLTIDAQRAAKRQVVADSFRRIGHRTVDVAPVRSGANAWRYRSRVSITIRRDGAGCVAGFHRHDDPSRIFALRDCRIADASLQPVIDDVRAAAGFLPDAAELRVTVRATGGAGAIVVEGGSRWDAIADFRARATRVGAIWWTPALGRRRRMDGGGGDPFASFAQVNPEVGAMLHAAVRDAVMAHRPKHVIDAYAGTGDVSAPLHAAGVRVTAIELDEDATAFLATRISSPSRAIAARVEDAIATLLPADVVILNPPRAGVAPAVTKALDAAAGRTRAIVYVSCDPATLARDVQRLPGWRVVSVTPFDMFPQTAHVETLVELRPQEAA